MNKYKIIIKKTKRNVDLVNLLPAPLIPFWHKLSSFVYEVCEGRDESHGYDHMEKVAINSVKIFNELYNVNYDNYDNYNDLIEHKLKLVIIVAWLHDVNDHKYVNENNNDIKKLMVSFLRTLYPDNYKNNDNQKFKIIFDIIDRISFSKEKKIRDKDGYYDWLNVLGEIGLEIRDIVSDADKLEALGKIGFGRCKMYTEEIYFKKYNKKIPYNILKENIIKHSHEKLLLLKDEYIRTDIGKKMAQPLHEQLLECLRTL